MAGRARTWLTVLGVVAASAVTVAVVPSSREARADANLAPVRAAPRAPAHERPVRAEASLAAAEEIAAQELALAPRGAEYGAWRGLAAGCSYMTPKNDFVASDGGVDVVFHFHAGQMSEREMKESGTNAVFVACGFGMGTGPYADRFAHPTAFGLMVDRLVKNLEAETKRGDIHLRHLGLASWSAGFAAVARILSVPRWYDATSAVVLLDSLHARYEDGPDRLVDTASMAIWIKLARAAAAGEKALVVTHSAIVPPDYASSTEATSAMLASIGISSTGATDDAFGARVTATRGRPMAIARRVDQGALHVRGYRGQGPKDHFDHLYLLGEALRTWVAPLWKREDRLVYTLAGEHR